MGTPGPSRATGTLSPCSMPSTTRVYATCCSRGPKAAAWTRFGNDMRHRRKRTGLRTPAGGLLLGSGTNAAVWRAPSHSSMDTPWTTNGPLRSGTPTSSRETYSALEPRTEELSRRTSCRSPTLSSPKNSRRPIPRLLCHIPMWPPGTTPPNSGYRSTKR